MVDKRMTEEDVVGELRDGMTIGIGGWGSRRKPMALVRALCRSSVKDLRIVSYGGPDVGLLCRAGKVREVVYAFVSLDSIALEPHFRNARQSGAVSTMRSTLMKRRCAAMHMRSSKYGSTLRYWPVPP